MKHTRSVSTEQVTISEEIDNLIYPVAPSRVPEQKETHHLTQMLRDKSNPSQLRDSGRIASKILSYRVTYKIDRKTRPSSRM